MNFSLDAFCDRKSFYGRCYVGRAGSYDTLYSYGTPILRLNCNTGKITRLWYGYSRTTQRHINAFLRYAGRLEFIGKHNTDKMEMGEWY